MRSLTLGLFLAFTFNMSAIRVQAEEASRAEVNVGVSLPLTGESAVWGEDLLKVLQFANHSLPGPVLNFKIEDDGCSSKQSATIAQKFASMQIKFVAGYLCSGALLAASPIFEKEKILAIALGASSPEISKAGEHIFRTSFNDNDGARYFAQYLAHKGVTKLGVISEENDYSLAFSNSLKQSAKVHGFEVIEERIAPGESDIRSAILRVQTKDIDGIFINPQGQGGLVKVLRRIKEFGIRTPLYSAYIAASQTFRDEVGILADGIEVLDIVSGAESYSEDGISLRALYTKKEGDIRTAEWVFPAAMEAVRAIKFAAKNESGLPVSLVNRPFKGTVGTWFFDQDGDLEGWHFQIRRISGHEIKTIHR